MYSSFESLPEEKRKKIIDVCIEEFAQKGYELASTNTIIKKAEISKGILFHYFKNKKNLFLYIIDYTLEIMSSKVYGALANQPADFIDRVVNSSLAKLKISYEYPEMYKILLDAYANTPAVLKGELQARYSKLYEEAIPFVLKDIDTSKFRKDIDHNKAIELLLISVEGIGNKYLKLIGNKGGNSLPEREKMIEEVKEYMEMLKNGIYEKPE